jgi:polysaccharide export outer membrane protein
MLVATSGALASLPVACRTPGPFVWAQDLQPSPADREAVIQPRDTLFVDLPNQKEISGEFTVRDDGHYLQPPIGSVRAAGLTPSRLAAEVQQRLVNVVVDGRVRVWLVRRAPIRVHVVGEVRTPGSYEMNRDRGLTAALAAAGWLTEFAGEEGIYVLRPAEHPARIRFRVRELTAAAPFAARFQLRDSDVVVVE